MLDAAKKMTNPNEQMWGVALYGVSWDLEQYWGVIKTFAENPGDDMFMKNVGKGKYEPNMLQPRTKGGTRFYVDWVHEHEITHPSSPSLSDEDAATLLGKGEVGMLSQIGDRRYKLNFPDLYDKGVFIAWAFPKLSKELGERFPDRYPELVGQEGHHGGHFWVYEQMHVVFDHPEESFKVLAHGIQPVNQLKIEEAYGQPPVISISGLEQVDSEEWDFGPIAKGQTEALLKYTNNYTVTGWPIGEMDTIRWETINTNISSAVSGEMTTDEALEKAQREIKEVLAGN
jgi:ABC-type glycerol-3-phosphate transport system substrate-binding protein